MESAKMQTENDMFYMTYITNLKVHGIPSQK